MILQEDQTTLELKALKDHTKSTQNPNVTTSMT